MKLLSRSTWAWIAIWAATTFFVLEFIDTPGGKPETAPAEAAAAVPAMPPLGCGPDGWTAQDFREAGWVGADVCAAWREGEAGYIEQGYKQLGFFRNAGGDRLFTIQIPRGAAAETVKFHAMGRPHRVGGLTLVYYYEAGLEPPARGVVSGKDWGAVRVRLNAPGAPRPSLVFMRMSVGEALHDCRTGVVNAFCHSAGR